MRTIRNLSAMMLIGLASLAFQIDAGAQTRGGESRSTRTVRSDSRSSNVNRSSSSDTRRRQPAASPSSSGRQSSARPSSQTRQPSARPAAPTRKPSAKPSSGTSSARPQSGTVTERKPSTSVRQPGGERMDANRPGNRPGTRKPSSAPAVRPERPGNRPGAGNSFRPDDKRPPVQVRPDHRHDRPRVHPVHRDFIAYDRPSHFWGPHNHYFGHRVRVLPARAHVHVHFGISYYCYNDIWYRPYGNHYVICRPPFGTILAANLIADMTWAAVRFSYYTTVASTYRQINENNAYIAEQNDIIARNNAIIAEQNRTIAMNQQQAAAAGSLADELGLIQSYAAAGSEYFYQDGVFYTKSADGEYRVIVPPAGALVETLPEDYEMVTLAGNDYYKVDDTIYKVTLSEGKPYFEVIGQQA